jgi:hypothetical protein
MAHAKSKKMSGLKRYLLSLVIATTMAPAFICPATSADPKDATGYYEGTATNKEDGTFPVSLNLSLTQKGYEAFLFTPEGNFPLKKASFRDGKLEFQFDAYGFLGTLDGRLQGGVMNGVFKYSDNITSITLRRTGDARALDSLEPKLHISKKQWLEDLQCFARELPKRHANAFYHVSRKQFDKAVAELTHRLGQMNGDEIYVGLNRIANLIGDGHTQVAFPGDGAMLPFRIQRFSNDYRVTFVAPGQEKSLGLRVVKIQDLPVNRAGEMLLSMTPQDETPALAQLRIENFLTTGLVLHGYGIISDRSTARFTLADDDNRQFSRDFHALPPRAEVPWVPACKNPPLFRQNPEDPFWYQSLPGAHAVYCNFRSYRELGKHASGLLAMVDRQQPDKLIIDLRQNGGGDYEEGLKYLVEPIRKRTQINRRGHLFVLIGRDTFSAAMSNSAHFRARTAALLVGEPIAEKPNSYQESRQFTLPNSHLVVRYSIRFYRFVESGENLIRPDQEIIPSWGDFKAGRDPVLAWVLKHG